MTTNETVISITFTEEDVRGIAADNDVDFDVALERAGEWAKHIGDTASSLVSTQLESVIISGQP